MAARQTVADAIRTRWPYTFEIVLFAAPIIVFVGIYLGVQSAIHRNDPVDHATRVLSIVGWSLPSFWVGMLLLAVFYSFLHWFSPGPLRLRSSDLYVNASFRPIHSCRHI